MKQIINYKNATVFDIESDGLLEEATKFHVLSYAMKIGRKSSIAGNEHDKLKKFFKYHIDNKIPVVAHNGILYDIPLSEKLLGIDLSKLMVIDTLALSWYLNFMRKSHGLDSFFEDYGIKKPKIDDWENLSYEEYENRCETDVEINLALWNDFIARLEDMYGKVKVCIDNGEVDGTRLSEDEYCFIDQYKQSSSVEDYINRIITYLCFKMDCLRLQEVTRWKADVGHLHQTEVTLEKAINEAKEELEAVMPPVPKYSKRKKPTKPRKKDGSLSASGEKWNELVELLQKGEKDKWGNPLAEAELGGMEIKVLIGYSPPNINSSEQIKSFLYSKGWEPRSFKYIKDKEAMKVWSDSGFKKELKPEMRTVPQITIDGEDGKELCDSVLELAEEVPEIMVYSKYSTIKHRYDMIQGFFRELSEDEYLVAKSGGFTNTIRMKHRAPLCNLPGEGKPYWEDIRGSLVADQGYVLEGSDLSSLEDRIKHHFMIVHDPDYVKTMLEEGFDPHILMGLTAGFITIKEYEDFHKGIKPEHVKIARKKGKTTNYASVYLAGPETIARSAGVPLAEGKKLHEAYWKLNWSVKAIAEEQCVIQDKSGNKWLINPISGLCYSLRKEADRFSTLCQGSGAFMFDMWLDRVLERMYEKWGVKRLCGQFHKLCCGFSQ